MRSLLIVALLASSAHADITRKQAVELLVKGDVEGLRAAAEFPLAVFGLWFDTEPCKKFANANVRRISEAELPALIKCVTELGPRAHGDPGSEVVLYGAGTPLAPFVGTRSGAPRLRGFGGILLTGYLDRDDAAPIEARLFTSKIAGFSREVPPPAKDRQRLDASSTLKAVTSVRMCVGPTGTVDSVATDDVRGDVPGYGEHVQKIVRGWKTTPFQLRGKAVRACARFAVGYPASRIDDIDLVLAPPPPPPRPPTGKDVVKEVVVERNDDTPPPPPPPGPQNVPPTLLEGNRKSGTKNILPDEATKKKMVEDGKDRVVGSWKLCITTTGAVTTVKRIKSSGYEAYDKLIEREMAKWAYNPYMVNGKAVPVCTAVTFIYSQK